MLGIFNSRHGLAHMDTCILCDPELSFCKLERKSINKNQSKFAKENVKKEPSVISEEKKISETPDKGNKDLEVSKNESTKVIKKDGLKVEKNKKDENEEEREMPELQLEVNVRTSSPPSSLTEELTHEEVPDLEPGAIEKNLSDQVNNEATKTDMNLPKNSDGPDKNIKNVEKDNIINDGDKEVKNEVVLKESLEDSEKKKSETTVDNDKEGKKITCDDVINQVEKKSDDTKKDNADLKDVFDKTENKEIKDEMKEKSEADETSVNNASKDVQQNNKQNEVVVPMNESNQYEKVSVINSMAAVIENVVSGDNERQKKFAKKAVTSKKMDIDEVNLYRFL